MKKVFFSMSLMLVGLFFVACTNSAPKAEGGEKAADGTEVKAEGADGAEAINIDDLKSIAEKATKDGANWTEAEWKDAFKKVIKAVKPMLVEMKEMQKKIESASEEDQLKMIGEMGEKMKGYQDASTQFEAFEKAIESSEVGKKIADDKEFQKEVEKELGLGEGFFDDL